MKKPTKKMLEKWTAMTDWNEHGLVREKIAKWFESTKEYKDNLCIRHYHEAFKWINEQHEKIGNMPMELCFIRNIVTNAMLNDIGSFDKNVEISIDKCL